MLDQIRIFCGSEVLEWYREAVADQQGKRPSKHAARVESLVLTLFLDRLNKSGG